MSHDLLLNEPGRADAPAGRIIPTDPDALLFEAETAYLLGQSKRTLADWRMTGGGPDYLRLGRQRGVRYRRRDLIAWMETRKRRSTSDSEADLVAPATADPKPADSVADLGTARPGTAPPLPRTKTARGPRRKPTDPSGPEAP